MATDKVKIDFVIKDSGVRQDYPSGMQRDTTDGKPAFALLLAEGVPYSEQMLTRWASHMAKGAEKYEVRNWEKACSQEEVDRFKSSALRHFMQWFCGETDEDHASAVFFNVNAAEVTQAKLNSQGYGSRFFDKKTILDELLAPKAIAAGSRVRYTKDGFEHYREHGTVTGAEGGRWFVSWDSGCIKDGSYKPEWLELL